jgi:hypothetical protein
MQGETMVYIMTINLAMKTRLTRVGVGVNGLRRIWAIIIPMRPTTCFQHLSSPLYCIEYDEVPFPNSCLSPLPSSLQFMGFKTRDPMEKTPFRRVEKTIILIWTCSVTRWLSHWKNVGLFDYNHFDWWIVDHLISPIFTFF